MENYIVGKNDFVKHTEKFMQGNGGLITWNLQSYQNY